MVIMFIFHNKHHCEQQKQVIYFIFIWTEMWTNIDDR